MSGPFRLDAKGPKALSPVGFRFDGRAYVGRAGDTLASALLANGRTLFGRSFKYHRPRGLLAAGVEEPNALVELDLGPGRREPNLAATTIELFEGLNASSQNRWPSLDFDLGALTGLAAPLLASGFYYKTFLWPRFAWAKIYEPVIRRMAGLGRAPDAPDPDRYGFTFAHCDVLIVGAGPAGVAAALAAAEGGGRVILCEQDSRAGGDLLSDPEATIEGHPAQAWIDSSVARLVERGVTILSRTTAAAYGIDNMVMLVERAPDGRTDGVRQRQWQVRAREVVLATGSHERPLVFDGNDIPGVMLAGAARTYLNRYGVSVGSSPIVCAAHDSAYEVALAFRRAGVGCRLLEMRAVAPAALASALVAAGGEVLRGRPLRAHGGRRVRALDVGLPDGAQRRMRTDAVLMAGGWTPAVHLYSQSRGKVAWSDRCGAYVPGEAAQNVRCAGAVTGLTALDETLAQGRTMGARAAGVGIAQPETEVHRDQLQPRADAAGAGFDPETSGGMAFVDFQNDVTAKDIRLAVREGFRSVEHIKRYTTTGMATDQGRTSNVNAMAIAGRAMERPTGQVGVTTFRAPYTPTTFGAWAGLNRGALFQPERRTPIDPWAEAQGAVFEPVSMWRRARYFPRNGEDMHGAVARECRTTRSAAGLFDASTLGKIEVAGPDAALFLEKMYVNPWAKLASGRCRYGVLLREDGFIYDDGVIGRLAPDLFHMTTSTSGAPGVLQMMEDYRQTEFPELQVWLTSTTEQWAVIAVNGPRARDILAPLVTGLDISREAFPHMAVGEGEICGAPLRLFRVSFTGEVGFEVNVPADRALEVWQAIHAEGQAHGACVYGTETMHVLRAEKGYIIVGQDTDGTVTPDDAGLTWAIGKLKPDFVGKRSLAREDLARTDRKQLVGLVPHDERTVFEEGAQVLPDAAARPFSAEGHVSSSYGANSLDRPIALALIARGRARLGETVFVTTEGPPVPATIVPSVFYDAAGERLSG